MQKESRKKVYTARRKVVLGSKDTLSKMGPKPVIYHWKSYSRSFWVVFTNINFPKFKKKLVNCTFVALNTASMLVIGL